MLCLSRKVNESIVLILEDGREIEVIVAKIGDGRRVRLGIECAKTIKIDRREATPELVTNAH